LDTWNAGATLFDPRPAGAHVEFGAAVHAPPTMKRLQLVGHVEVFSSKPAGGNGSDEKSHSQQPVGYSSLDTPKWHGNDAVLEARSAQKSSIAQAAADRIPAKLMMGGQHMHNASCTS